MKELSEKTKNLKKNYEVTVTLRMHANSEQHARMKIDSPWIEIINFNAKEL